MRLSIFEVLNFLIFLTIFGENNLYTLFTNVILKNILRIDFKLILKSTGRLAPLKIKLKLQRYKKIKKEKKKEKGGKKQRKKQKKTYLDIKLKKKKITKVGETQRHVQYIKFIFF